MHRILVEEKNWISESRFLHALNLHTLFRQTYPVEAYPRSFDMPVLAVDVAALVLSIAAGTAIFRFKLGMLTVRGGRCAAGVAQRLAGVI